jgi:CxxC motif-containing protein (DUF1111 family)
MKLKKEYAIAFSLGFFAACEGFIPEGPEENEILDGPIASLNTEENNQFLLGDIAFNDEIFSTDIGLGPYFVATSCGTCHAGDGKGHPFTTLTRFGQSDTTGNTFLNRGGPQLQNRAIPGHIPEQIPPGASFTRLTPPANTGLGFLEALTDRQILSNSDPVDQDGDGISGRPNYIDVPDYFEPLWYHQTKNGKYIGRFGKKASVINLLQQTVNAYREDIGITTDFVVMEPSIYGKPNETADRVADPEISAATLGNVVFYLRTLKAPVQRDQNNPGVRRGRQVFDDISCAKCHTPEWTTPVSDIPGLSEKKFYPYTDLLLHDMGPGLNDGYTEGTALPEEWRTPPLWGLGLAKDSQGGQYFLLHDGRAGSFEEAIRLHGGEAESSKDQFLELAEEEKADLIRFLESL